MHTHKRVALATAMLLAACWDGRPHDRIPTAPGRPDSLRSTSALARGDDPRADTVARALGVALGQAPLRLRLRDDLRDSPFARHALHLRSYLHGVAGTPLRQAMTSALGGDESALDRLLAALPGLELRLERPYDRATWTGSDSIAVYGSALPTDIRVRASPTQLGFRAGGDSVTIAIWSAAPFPYLAIQPVETPFGRDPEAERRRAPVRTRPTVSTRDDEISTYLVATCTPDDPSGCGSSILPETGGITLPSQYTRAYCFGVGTAIASGADLDQDGFRDDCEGALATAFRPERRISGSDRAPGGEPKFSAARRLADSDGRSEVAIFYALSYYRDPGSPAGSIDAHDGDSEFIIVELHAAEGSRWVTDYVTFSAHWNAGWGVDHTARYFQDVLEWTGGSRARVHAWVSTDKHANYRSRSVCMSQWNDFCGYEYSYSAYDTPLVSPANLGGIYNSFTPAVLPMNNCQRSQNPSYAGIECFWNFQPFAGWHPLVGQATATTYTQPLGFFGF